MGTRNNTKRNVLAVALWDAESTTRLSEHPEETERIDRRASALLYALVAIGWTITRKRRHP